MHRQVRISTETKYKCKKELELKNLTTEKYKWGIQQGTKWKNKEKISELKDKAVEFIQSEEQKKGKR